MVSRKRPATGHYRVVEGIDSDEEAAASTASGGPSEQEDAYEEEERDEQPHTFSNWTAADDDALCKWVQAHGTSRWTDLASADICGSMRTNDSLRARYNRLHPELRIASAAAAAAVAPPMTAKEAIRTAEAEGLTLIQSRKSSTGYRCVKIHRGPFSIAKPYMVQIHRDNKRAVLGWFSTAEEAALCFARSPEGRAAAEAVAAGRVWSRVNSKKVAEEARLQAEADEVAKLRSSSSITGYKYVSLDTRSALKPYKVFLRRGTSSVHRGSFATAEEAALNVVRTLERVPAMPIKRKRNAEESHEDEAGEKTILVIGEVASSPQRDVTVIEGLAFVATVRV